MSPNFSRGAVLVAALLALLALSVTAAVDHEDRFSRSFMRGFYDASAAGIKQQDECMERGRHGCAFSQLKCCEDLVCKQRTDAEGLQSWCDRPGLCIPWHWFCIDTESCCLGYTCRKSNDSSLLGRCDY